MALRSFVCALSLFIPHAIAMWVPFPFAALVICIVVQAMVCFPLYCGLCRKKLFLGFGKLWVRFFLCGLDLGSRFCIVGFVVLFPFELLKNINPFLAALAGGIGITVWIMVCTRWLYLAQFAHCTHRQAFLRSALAVKKAHINAFFILLQTVFLMVFILTAPYALRRAAEKTTVLPPSSVRLFKPQQLKQGEIS